MLDNLEAVLKAAETSLSRLCRLHFAAERLNADLNIEYYDPIAATQAEVIAQAANEVGSEAAERVRLEVEAIDPELLIGVVEAPT